MKNKKVFVPVETFKNLISEDTLQILKVLDKHSLSLIQLKDKTNIPESQLQSQLQRLLQGRVVKRKKRKDTLHYSLSFRGSSLLHPENSHIMILFSASILTLLIALGSIVHWIIQSIPDQQEELRLLQESDNVVKGPLTLLATETSQNVQDPLFATIAFIGIILFTILICFTYWRYKKNKPQAL
jgi:hypothetical protein